MKPAQSNSHPKLRLPKIIHPNSRLGNLEEIGIRGVSRASNVTCDKDGARFSMISPRKSRKFSNKHENNGLIIKTNGEEKETYNNPSESTLFKESLELDAMESTIKDKLRLNYSDVKKKFTEIEQELNGVTLRDGLNRLITAILGKFVTHHQLIKLLKRVGLPNNDVINFADFATAFSDQQTKDYPVWMDTLYRSQTDPIYMSAGDVHQHLQQEARQKFLDLEFLIPQHNPDGARYIEKAEFYNALRNLNFNMENAEFDKLWERYDPGNKGTINSERLLNILGINLSPRPQDFKLLSGNETEEKQLKTKVAENGTVLYINDWLKTKFRKEQESMQHSLEKHDHTKSGKVSSTDFLLTLKHHGLSLERSLLPAFLSYFGVSLDGDNVPYGLIVDRPPQNQSDDPASHGIGDAELDPLTERGSISDDQNSGGCLHSGRTEKELFTVIKHLVTSNYSALDRAFRELDLLNSGRLSQDTMYRLLKQFEISPEITTEEIQTLWKTFLTNRDKTLDFHEFLRHFGHSMRSAAFPNAKITPPQRGDADCMQRSRKFNCDVDMLHDSLRSKIEITWNELNLEFLAMDPDKSGCVSEEKFKQVLTKLCSQLGEAELDLLTKKFKHPTDDSVSYVRMLQPFMERSHRRGHDMQKLLRDIDLTKNSTTSIVSKDKLSGLQALSTNVKEKLFGDWRSLRRSFRRLDTTNQGTLKVSDFRSVLDKVGVSMDDVATYEIMVKYDRDMTGRVPYEQFIIDTFRPKSHQKAYKVC